MPHIKTPFQFEPSNTARSIWISTRKEPFSCGPNIFPGFYQTSNFISDTIWVIFALLIEITALIMILIGGFQNGGLWLLGSILSVILFITLDVIGIIFIHSRTGNIQFLINRIIIEEENIRPGLIELVKRHNYSFKKIFGYIALILSSLLKITSVLLLIQLHISFYIVLALFYFLVVYVHSKHTGYWLMEVSTIIVFKRNYQEYSNGLILIPQTNIRNSARELNTPFESELELRLPIEVGAHRIILNSSYMKAGVQTYQYTLTTKGILTDNDIILLAQNQLTNSQKDIIGKICLKHQLFVIHP